VNDSWIDFVLWILASPLLFIQWLLRLRRRWRFWRTAYATQIVCSGCHSAISLLGNWTCQCGYSYRGHVMRECPICGAQARMVRCYACGLTEKLPEP
jgi:hypothetical protein